MVLKRHHFYGVHHGDIAIRWLEEGDKKFSEDNCTGHTWFEEVMAHMAYSKTRVSEVDLAEISDEVDLEHRRRLDIVHDRLGLSRLDAVAFNVDYMAAGLTQEGDRLQRAAGPQLQLEYTSEETVRAAGATDLTTRFRIRAHDRVAKEPMQCILYSIAGSGTGLGQEQSAIPHSSERQGTSGLGSRPGVRWRRS
jgi:hypothetical protein